MHRNDDSAKQRPASPASSTSALRLLAPYFRQSAVVIFLGLACLVGVDLCQLFIPRIIKRVVDGLTRMNLDGRQLLIYGLAIMGIATIAVALRFGWRRCFLWLSRRVEEGLRNRLFSHIQTLSPAYFNQVKTGDLMAHATNDLTHIRMATGMGLVALTDAVFLGTAAILFMAYINLELTFLAIIPMPLIVLGTRFFSKKMFSRYLKVQAAFSDLTENVRERFAGIRVIKAFNWKQNAIRQLDAASRLYVGRNLDLVKITGSFMPMMLLFSNLSLASVLFFGGRRTIMTTITTGDFVAFINYLAILTWPMMALGWLTNLIQRGAASLRRIDAILQIPPEIADAPSAVTPVIRGELNFKSVNFAYPGTPSPPLVLQDIDFKLTPGSVLGVTGPPGSGKSTLLSLIPRMFDVTAGQIRIDGTDIRQLQLDYLRRQIALAPQEPFLFSGTIRQNITFGDENVDAARLHQALEAAALNATLDDLPHGLETLVGEKGVILSGGQRQRVAIARAFCQPSPILLLDDPVSQVDLETGRHMINAFKSLTGTHTLVIVSHRLSALKFADTILVLDQGRISESGTHAQLIQQDGFYARTWRLQAMEEEWHAN